MSVVATGLHLAIASAKIFEAELVERGVVIWTGKFASHSRLVASFILCGGAQADRPLDLVVLARLGLRA